MDQNTCVTMRTSGGNLIDITSEKDMVESPFWIHPDDILAIADVLKQRVLDYEVVSELIDIGYIRLRKES